MSSATVSKIAKRITNAIDAKVIVTTMTVAKAAWYASKGVATSLSQDAREGVQIRQRQIIAWIRMIVKKDQCLFTSRHFYIPSFWISNSETGVRVLVLV